MNIDNNLDPYIFHNTNNNALEERLFVEIDPTIEPAGLSINNRLIRTISDNIILYTPEEFLVNLKYYTLPLDKKIQVTGNVTIQNSRITSLPHCLTIMGNLTIQNCMHLTNFPENLVLSSTISNNYKVDDIIMEGGLNNTTKGNLTIDNCPNITSLPNGLALFYLSLSRCNITNLPSDLTKIDNLTINNCPNITSLPNRLALFSLSLYRCNITNLPNDIIIKDKLKIHTCHNISALPKKLVINELYINECNGIILSQDTEINKIIHLTGLHNPIELHNAIELPTINKSVHCVQISNCSDIQITQVLNFRGDLHLSNCDITTLPEDMFIGNNLYIHSCNELQLPAKIKISNAIYITFCMNFTKLPDSWFADLPDSFPNVGDKDFMVILKKTGISADTVQMYNDYAINNVQFAIVPSH